MKQKNLFNIGKALNEMMQSKNVLQRQGKGKIGSLEGNWHIKFCGNEVEVLVDEACDHFKVLHPILVLQNKFQNKHAKL